MFAACLPRLVAQCFFARQRLGSRSNSIPWILTILNDFARTIASVTCAIKGIKSRTEMRTRLLPGIPPSSLRGCFLLRFPRPMRPLLGHRNRPRTCPSGDFNDTHGTRTRTHVRSSLHEAYINYHREYRHDGRRSLNEKTDRRERKNVSHESPRE